MDVSRILLWNMRGLNRKSRRDAVRSMFSTALAAGVCVWGWWGGILLAWKGSVCTTLAVKIDVFLVSVWFEQSDASPWWFIGVYGHQSDALKIQFLQELHHIRQACLGPWIVGGDFNLIYSEEDKNNTNLDRGMMDRFRRSLNDLDHREVALMGRKYTWSNEREDPTLVRLDSLCYYRLGAALP
jgi:hypothetical protein